MLYFIRLLDLNTNSNGVYARLNQDFFVLISSNNKWVEDNLRCSIGLNLGNIMSFSGLGSEIAQ